MDGNGAEDSIQVKILQSRLEQRDAFLRALCIHVRHDQILRAVSSMHVPTAELPPGIAELVANMRMKGLTASGKAPKDTPESIDEDSTYLLEWGRSQLKRQSNLVRAIGKRAVVAESKLKHFTASKSSIASLRQQLAEAKQIQEDLLAKAAAAEQRAADRAGSTPLYKLARKRRNYSEGNSSEILLELRDENLRLKRENQEVKQALEARREAPYTEKDHQVERPKMQQLLLQLEEATATNKVALKELTREKELKVEAQTDCERHIEEIHRLQGKIESQEASVAIARREVKQIQSVLDAKDEKILLLEKMLKVPSLRK
eukprot:g2863.t1